MSAGIKVNNRQVTYSRHTYNSALSCPRIDQIFFLATSSRGAASLLSYFM